MGVTQLISPFYRQLDPETFRRQFESGQIAWIPTPFAADVSYCGGRGLLGNMCG